MVVKTTLIPINEKIKKMFKKIVRDNTGGIWFVKAGKKQKVETVLDLTGALVDEIGAKTLDDKTLNSYPNFKFFGK